MKFHKFILLCVLLLCTFNLSGQNNNGLIKQCDSLLNEAKKSKDIITKINLYKTILEYEVFNNGLKNDYQCLTNTLEQYKIEIVNLEKKNKNNKYSNEISYYYGLKNYLLVFNNKKPDEDELKKSINLVNNECNEWFLFYSYFSYAYLHEYYKPNDLVSAKVNYKISLECLKKSRDIVPKNKYFNNNFYITMYKLIELSDRLSQYSESIVYCDSMIKYINKYNYLKESLSLPSLYKARALVILCKPFEAYQIFQQEINPVINLNSSFSEFLKKHEYDRYTLTYYDILSYLCEYKSSVFFETAHQFCGEIIKEYKIKKDSNNVAVWLWHEAKIYKLESLDNSAVNCMDSAMIYDNYSGVPQCLYRDICLIYGGNEHYQKGKIALKRVLKRFYSVGMPENIAMAYRNISDLCLENQEYDSAFYYLKKAPILTIRDSIYYLESAATIYSEERLFDSALISIQKAICFINRESCSGLNYLNNDILVTNIDYNNQTHYDLFKGLMEKSSIMQLAYEMNNDKKYLVSFYITALLIINNYNGFFRSFNAKKTEADWFEFSKELHSKIDYP